ncbi:hypothetical protein YT1_0867 [Rhodococcus ruber]|nr:hypothetical protein YT1_0867 [Rhodococcus ruber]
MRRRPHRPVGPTAAPLPMIMPEGTPGVNLSANNLDDARTGHPDPDELDVPVHIVAPQRSRRSPAHGGPSSNRAGSHA